MWTARPELRLTVPGGVADDGISHGGWDQIPAHPYIALVEIQQFRGVKDVPVEPEWIPVLYEVLIERIVRWPIDLVTVKYASAAAQLRRRASWRLPCRRAAGHRRGHP